MASEDPYYMSSAAAFIRGVLQEVLNVTVFVDDHLRSAVAADRKERAIWVQPGLPLDVMQSRAGRAWRYIELGARGAPEFREPKTVDPTISRSALIIPMQRSSLEQLAIPEPSPLPGLATT